MADHAPHSPVAISPLAGRLPLTLPGLALSEGPLVSLVQIASWPGGDAALDAALSRENVPAMPAPLGSATRGTATIMNVAPGRALVAAQRGDLFEALSASIPADQGTVTDLSHARILLRADGPRSRWVLAKGVAIDLHPDAFPIGRTVVTSIAHIGTVLRRAGADAYELYPYRGYAAALLDWLEEAGAADGREAA